MMKLFFCLLCCFTLRSSAQTITPDVRVTDLWQLYNREAREAPDGGVELNKAPNDGLMILKSKIFGDMVIELKVKGENKQGESFVGIAFNVQDEKRYESIYFRPFNFLNKERETHSVQYVSMPEYGWDKLRNNFPDKYENRIQPPPEPNGWFSTKIVISGKSIKVFVNDATTPSLEVESLAASRAGRFALMVGNNSKGSFKDLKITQNGSTAFISRERNE
jgi:3-keto-disaccharide hydrolase